MLTVKSRGTKHVRENKNVQGLENVLWAYATFGQQPSIGVLSRTADYLVQNIDAYNQQNLALTLWAYAKLGFEVSSSVTFLQCLQMCRLEGELQARMHADYFATSQKNTQRANKVLL